MRAAPRRPRPPHADHGPWPVAVPVALGPLGTPVPEPPERLGDLLLDQLLQKLAHPAAHLLLERIEPLASLRANPSIPWYRFAWRSLPGARNGT